MTTTTPQRTLTFGQKIGEALRTLLLKDDSVILIGEDLKDPFGGSFKVTSGLSTEFPDHVFNSPISEPALIGMGAGMALTGTKPIVEIMFSDFLTLGADQLINHAVKFVWMYGKTLQVPLMIRTACGAGKSYGPTHSQSPENFFLGFPDLEIWSPTPFHDLEALYWKALQSPKPKIVLEAKALYPIRASAPPLLKKTVRNGGTLLVSNSQARVPDLTILTYGRMSEKVLSLLSKCWEEEIFVECVLPSRIYPFDLRDCLDSLKKSRRLMIVEETYSSHGFGSFVSSQVHEGGFDLLKKPIKVLGNSGGTIGSTPQMEEDVLPSEDSILKAIRELVAV